MQKEHWVLLRKVGQAETAAKHVASDAEDRDARLAAWGAANDKSRFREFHTPVTTGNCSESAVH